MRFVVCFFLLFVVGLFASLECTMHPRRTRSTHTATLTTPTHTHTHTHHNAHNTPTPTPNTPNTPPNTHHPHPQGKKAKRKAREKQLEEAKRLESLQKRRELKAAGLSRWCYRWGVVGLCVVLWGWCVVLWGWCVVLWGRQGRRAHTLHLTLTPSPTPHPHPHSHSSGKFHMKVKKGIDYNAEIPFERPVPAGFFEVTQEADHANLKDFKSIVLQNVDEVGMPATAKTARANTTQLAAHNPQSPQSPPSLPSPSPLSLSLRIS